MSSHQFFVATFWNFTGNGAFVINWWCSYFQHAWVVMSIWKKCVPFFVVVFWFEQDWMMLFGVKCMVMIKNDADKLWQGPAHVSLWISTLTSIYFHHNHCSDCYSLKKDENSDYYYLMVHWYNLPACKGIISFSNKLISFCFIESFRKF